MDEGKRRLHPSLTDPNWLVLCQRRELFRGWLSQFPRQQLDVLDIGGRVQPYRSLLNGRLRRYVALDLRRTPLVDVMARGEQLPFQEGYFDIVLCTQVLEYIPDSRQAISEMHRVLRPGGMLLISAPAIFPIDSENDLWRFTGKGLNLLLKDFSHVEVRGEGSSIHGLFRTIAVWIGCLAKPPIVARLLRWTVIPLLNLAALCLSGILPTSNDQFSANFSAMALK